MVTHKINRILILCLIVASTFIWLTSCNKKVNINGLSDYYYTDSEKYVAGEAELSKMVENIEISWLVGNVILSSSSSNTISFVEKSDNQLIENTKLHYWLDNTTLRIKFCGCGKWNLSELEKELVVLVPNTLNIRNLGVKTLSANIYLSNFPVTQLVDINTLSGNLEAKFNKPLNKFYGQSTSGSFKVSAPSISRYEVSTLSGYVNLEVSKEPDWLDIDTTSGNTYLVFPKSASFTLEYDTTSGDLYSNLIYYRSSGKYIFGEGNKIYMIVSVSGNVQIFINE